MPELYGKVFGNAKGWPQRTGLDPGDGPEVWREKPQILAWTLPGSSPAAPIRNCGASRRRTGRRSIRPNGPELSVGEWILQGQPVHVQEESNRGRKGPT